MIVVRALWNTYPDGSRVDVETVDWDAKDAPVSLYGPFVDMDVANAWVENEYPEDDQDVFDMEAVDMDVPDGFYVNDPDVIYGDIPDEDIRPEDPQEIHGP